MTAHRLPVTVYWEDTDAGGIVYHGAYLRFAERGRTEMLRDLGIGQADLLARTGLGFVVRRAEIDFDRPARLDDRLEVVTELADLTGARVLMDQRVMPAGRKRALARLRVELAVVDRAGRPRRLPEAITAALQRFHASA